MRRAGDPVLVTAGQSCARCWGQGSPHVPLPALLPVRCLGMQQCPAQTVQPDPGEGRTTMSLGEGDLCPLKLNSVGGRVESFLSPCSKETQSLEAEIP